MGRWRGRGQAVVITLSLAGSALVGVANGVAQAGPASPGTWVVTIGDSAISGEAGRWAGNTNNASGNTDAGGIDAYWNNPTRTAEATPGCHRSEAAEAHIGGGISSLNLACSGARTYTQTGANYWGQLAMRNCLRQAFNGRAVRGGGCTSTGGLNANGEPNMVLN